MKLRVQVDAAISEFLLFRLILSEAFRSGNQSNYRSGSREYKRRNETAERKCTMVRIQYYQDNHYDA